METLDLDEGSKNKEPDYPIKHKDANTALVLGIISLVIFFTPLGLATAAFGIVSGARAMKESKEMPEKYTTDSIKIGKAGFVTSIIAIVAFVVGGLIYIVL